MPRLRSTAIAALAVAATLAALHAVPATAQDVQFPRLSPNATVTQTVGMTEIEIHYSRPGVKGRKIWGGLVPYGEVWRTGANENTTLSASTPFSLEGHELPAGTYGVQTIPTDGAWTLILSKDADRWGAFSYKPENDALRVTLKPRPAAQPVERLLFRFDDVTDDAATVVLAWENLEVPFRITADTTKLVVEKANQALRWQTPLQAANYCIEAKTCLDEAVRWLDLSLAIQPTFSNQRAQARLLALRGDFEGAVAAGEKALATAKTASPPPPANQVTELEGWVKEWGAK
jgi:DUF2911 family protein